MIAAAFKSASDELTIATGTGHDAFQELIQAIEEHPEIAWMLKSWATSPLAASTIRLQNALTAGKTAIGKC